MTFGIPFVPSVGNSNPLVEILSASSCPSVELTAQSSRPNSDCL